MSLNRIIEPTCWAVQFVAKELMATNLKLESPSWRLKDDERPGENTMFQPCLRRNSGPVAPNVVCILLFKNPFDSRSCSFQNAVRRESIQIDWEHMVVWGGSHCMYAYLH